MLTLFAAPCHAQELDTLLGNIPGYGKPFGVVLPPRHQRGQTAGLQFGNVSLLPQLSTAVGYDSAPNGASGSAVLAAAPSLLVTDTQLGFGAYARANASLYPQDNTQNIFGTTLGIGERAVLPGEIVTVSAAYLNTQETGFALNTIAISRPLRFSALDLRASDEISAGQFTLKPELSTTTTQFPSLEAENRTDNREGLTTAYLPGGPVDLLLRLQATQSDYHTPTLNAETNQALAGLLDTADGLWTFSALAGAAQRLPRTGPALLAPVLEAGLDWMPTELDRLRLTLMREIDDPEDISATPYTLTQEKLSLTHEYLTDVLFRLSEQASNAAYLQSSDRETLFSSDAGVSWQLNPDLALDGDYAFNDRQANYLRAANEHVVTIGLTWTP